VADTVVINATNGDDTITLSLVNGDLVVDGLTAQVVIAHSTSTTPSRSSASGVMT
jgi:hypothetical protein